MRQQGRADAGGRTPYIAPTPPTGPNVIVLELVIFAALAAVVLFQLYAVLGRRVGRQPTDDQAKLDGRKAALDDARPAAEPESTEGLTGLALLRAKDPSFDVGHFLTGARGAYQMIVTAYAAGDRDALRPLLSDDVYAAFEGGIDARDPAAPVETVTFAHPPRADMEQIDVEDAIARVTVRFLAEFRAVHRDEGGGEVGVDRRTAEVWTFERRIDNANPNWLLARVDAAEA